MPGMHRRGRSVEFAKPEPAQRTDVTCPSCGGPTLDGGPGRRRPRWRCLRGSCPFANGWMLDFPGGIQLAGVEGSRPAPDAGDHPAMVAVPYAADGNLRHDLAVIWPRDAAASTSQEAA